MTPDVPALKDLAGAILDRVSINWRNAIAHITFLRPPAMRESHALRVSGLARLEIAEKGDVARVVREVRIREGSPLRIEIVMEGGETLRFEAREAALDPIGG
jgi:hypothetical protein